MGDQVSVDMVLLAINKAVQQAMVETNRLVDQMGAEIVRLKTENEALKKALPKE